MINETLHDVCKKGLLRVCQMSRVAFLHLDLGIGVYRSMGYTIFYRAACTMQLCDYIVYCFE
jgi:hypothetical protein